MARETQTGNGIYTLTGRIARIVPPDKQHEYSTFWITKGKYSVIIEDPDMPASGWWRRFIYRYNHEMEEVIEHTVLMSVCPYSVGDMVELAVAKVLVPSGYCTTEMDRI